EEARRKLVAGLQDMVALGVTTNQVFLASCLQHPVFAQGGATTAFIGQHQDSLLQRDAAQAQRAAALAAVLLLETSAGAQRGGGEGRLRASMNGGVVAVRVEPGQRVQGGQPVVTLEAMKMEHIHCAPLAGIVKTLHVSAGDQVSAHRVVAEIEADLETSA